MTVLGDRAASAEIPFRTSHTWAIPGEIKVASGDTDYIPLFWVDVATGQSVKLVKMLHRINSGTSATVKLQKSGVDITGFTGVSVTTTGTVLDPADVALVANDQLALIVTAVAGTPKNMSVTVVLEHLF